MNIPSNVELAKEWEEKKDVLSLQEFADSYGLTYSSMAKRTFRGRKKIQSSTGEKSQNKRDHQSGEELLKLRTEKVHSDQADLVALDALLEEANADLETWRVYRWSPRKWAVGAKHPKTGQILKEPLYGVAAWLEEIDPAPVSPTVTPVQVKIPRATRPKKKKKAKVGKALNLADVHGGFRKDFRTGKLIPFHDRRALDVALQIARSEKFDFVIWLGDLLDSAEWSDKFLRSPEFYWTTQPAICEVAWWIAQFVQVQRDAEHIAIEGNHDVRPENSIIKHLKQAYDLRPARELHAPHALSMDRLLRMEEMGVKWVGGYAEEKADFHVENHFAATHGHIARKNPGSTALGMAKKWGQNVVYGHVHRREMVTMNVYQEGRDRLITAMSPGLLGRIDYVIPGHRKGQDWQQGLGTVNFGKDIKPKFDIIPIENGKALYQDELFEARDENEILEDLDAGTDWKFERG